MPRGVRGNTRGAGVAVGRCWIGASHRTPIHGSDGKNPIPSQHRGGPQITRIDTDEISLHRMTSQVCPQITQITQIDADVIADVRCVRTFLIGPPHRYAQWIRRGAEVANVPRSHFIDSSQPAGRRLALRLAGSPGRFCDAWRHIWRASRLSGSIVRPGNQFNCDPQMTPGVDAMGSASICVICGQIATECDEVCVHLFDLWA